jgi:hypothetical protein
MTSEPHLRAVGSLRAVVLDAPDIGLLATFCEQFAGWRRVPGDDAGEWITIGSGQLGASVLRRNERWHTLADLAGHPFDLCVSPDDRRATLMSVMLGCPDAKELSHFYAELLGKPVTYQADGLISSAKPGQCYSREESGEGDT